MKNPGVGGTYPQAIDTPGKRALYDNLGNDRNLALAVDHAVYSSRMDDWRNNPFKVKKVRIAIRAALELTARGTRESLGECTERILTLVKNQDEY